MPITLEIYREIAADLRDAPPEGLILHVAPVLENGHLQDRVPELK